MKICWYRTSAVVCFFDLEFHTLDMNIVWCRKMNKLLPEITAKFAESGIWHHNVSWISNLPNGKRRVFYNILYHFQFMFCAAQSINVRSSGRVYELYLYIFMFFVMRKIAWSCFQDEPSSLMPSLPSTSDVAPGKRCSKNVSRSVKPLANFRSRNMLCAASVLCFNSFPWNQNVIFWSLSAVLELKGKLVFTIIKPETSRIAEIDAKK